MRARTDHPRVRKCPFVESGTGAPTRAQVIAGRLAEVLEEPLEGQVRRLSSGASRETFAFATRARGGLVVQIARGGGSKIVRAPPQARLLAAAAEAGVPVPRVVAHGEDDEVLGMSWAVVEALEGTTDPKAILAGEGAPRADELIDEIAAALAAVHRMPKELASAPPAEDPLALLRTWHDGLGEPHPAFELAFRALESGRPGTARSTLVHGDFRMGNLMVADSGLTGVLDWELTHVGDPGKDIARRQLRGAFNVSIVPPPGLRVASGCSRPTHGTRAKQSTRRRCAGGSCTGRPGGA